MPWMRKTWRQGSNYRGWQGLLEWGAFIYLLARKRIQWGDGLLAPVLYLLGEKPAMVAIPMFSPVLKEVDVGLQRPGWSSSWTRKQILGHLWLYLSLSPLCLVNRWKDQRRKKRGGNMYFLSTYTVTDNRHEIILCSPHNNLTGL